MALELKPFTFLDIDETMEFLKIPDVKKTEYRNQVIRLINMACQKIEDYIDRPVLEREFVEFRDGNSSNVIVPTYGPIKKVVELKIDFNRAFDVATALSADNYVLRGLPNMQQQASRLADTNSLDVTELFEIDGTDIVIRDDNNMALLGRLFTGSVVQSVKLTYRAGIAKDMQSVPDTIKYAALLICDHFYMARENRDLGVKSKSTHGGQSYSKELGVPQEIEDLLHDYKDYSFGPYDVPQKNTFQT